MKKIKNFILKSITWFAIVVWLTALGSIDSENVIIPVVSFILSSVWLFLFTYANQMYFWKWEHGEV